MKKLIIAALLMTSTCFATDLRFDSEPIPLQCGIKILGNNTGTIGFNGSIDEAEDVTIAVSSNNVSQKARIEITEDSSNEMFPIIGGGWDKVRFTGQLEGDGSMFPSNKKQAVKVGQEVKVYAWTSASKQEIAANDGITVTAIVDVVCK